MSSKVCVIVGAGPSLGMSLARRFAREGFQIALIARRAGALAEYAAALSAELNLPEGTVYGVTGDVSDPDSLRSALANIEARSGPPDVMVYNAAVLDPVYPHDLSIERFMTEMMIDVGGALVASQWAAPLMQARGSGTILLTGGGLGIYPHMYYTTVSVGKAALRSLNACLAQELEPEHIHVATVTITQLIEPDTKYDPDTIAEFFWKLHAQPEGEWEQEIIY